MTESENSHVSELEEDTLYRHSLREAVFILSCWVCCFVYTVTYCYLTGYQSHDPHPNSTGIAVGAIVGPLSDFNRDPSTLSMPFGLGIPDWVLYGVVIPWLVCILISFWFCLCFFSEDELGEDVAAVDR